MDGSRELPPNPTPAKNIPQNVPIIKKKAAASFLPRLDVAVFFLKRAYSNRNSWFALSGRGKKIIDDAKAEYRQLQAKIREQGSVSG